MSLVLLALQASLPQISRGAPRDFDLKEVVTAERLKAPATGGRCAADPAAIVVCGRRDPDRYRYVAPEPRPEWEELGLPRAEMGLGNGATGALELEQEANPDGTVSKRIMVRVKTKF